MGMGVNPKQQEGEREDSRAHNVPCAQRHGVVGRRRMARSQKADQAQHQPPMLAIFKAIDAVIASTSTTIEATWAFLRNMP